MPMFSVVVATCRPRMDFTLASLNEQTFKDFELIIADELYDSRPNTKDLTSKQLPNLNFIHVKPPIYPYVSVASTFNAGLKVAKGNFITILGDYSVIDPNYLQRIVDDMDKYPQYSPVAIYVDHDVPEDALKDISVYDLPRYQGVRYDDRHYCVQRWLDDERGIITGEWVLGLITMPREVFWRINGFNTCYNCGKGRSDFSLVNRAEKFGVRFMLDTKLVVHRVAHPHDNLKGVFQEKVSYRTSAENRRIFQIESTLVNHGVIPIDAFVGIEDRRWKRHHQLLAEGGGAEFCTKRMVSILNNHGIPIYHNNPNCQFDPTAYIIYGVAMGNVLTVLAKLNLDRTKIYYWWTGSDVWALLKGQLNVMTHHPNVKHLCVSERLQKELKSVGIDAEILYDVHNDWHEIVKMREANPYRGGVLAYTGTSPYWDNDSLLEIIKKTPDIQYLVCGLTDDVLYKQYDLPNVTRYKWLNDETMMDALACSHAYIRMSNHDGLPAVLLESLRAGIPVVENYPYYGVEYVKNVDEATSKLHDILQDKITVPDEVVKYYREHYNVKRFVKEFVRIFYGVDLDT